MLQLASDVVDGCARGFLVDPDFPLQLGQHRHSRRLHLTDVAVNMHSDEWHDLKPGQIYTIFGASTPVNKNGMWHIQMPRATRGTAVIHNLGWGNGILANKLDSEHESACTTSCAEQVSTSPPVDDEPHGDLCFGLIDLVTTASRAHEAAAMVAAVGSNPMGEVMVNAPWPSDLQRHDR